MEAWVCEDDRLEIILDNGVKHVQFRNNHPRPESTKVDLIDAAQLASALQFQHNRPKPEYMKVDFLHDAQLASGMLITPNEMTKMEKMMGLCVDDICTYCTTWNKKTFKLFAYRDVSVTSPMLKQLLEQLHVHEAGVFMETLSSDERRCYIDVSDRAFDGAAANAVHGTPLWNLSSITKTQMQPHVYKDFHVKEPIIFCLDKDSIGEARTYSPWIWLQTPGIFVSAVLRICTADLYNARRGRKKYKQYYTKEASVVSVILDIRTPEQMECGDWYIQLS